MRQRRDAPWRVQRPVGIADLANRRKSTIPHRRVPTSFQAIAVPYIPRSCPPIPLALGSETWSMISSQPGNSLSGFNQPEAGASFRWTDTSLRSRNCGMASQVRVMHSRLALRSVYVARPSELRTMLDLSVGPAEPGSLIVPVAVTSPMGQLDMEWTKIATLFWRMTANSLWRAARGLAAVGLTAASAQSFAKAAAMGGNRGFVQVELVERRDGSKPWRTNVNLTSIERGLRQYVSKKSEPMESTERLVGQVVGLDWDRPSLTLDAPGRKLTVRMPAKLRKTAQALWGKEVAITAKAKLTLDGELRDPIALQIEEAVEVSDFVDDFDNSFGRFKDVFTRPEVQDYLSSLRGESS